MKLSRYFLASCYPDQAPQAGAEQPYCGRYGYLIMLEYRQRTFQGAFHASNDYMHWYGWAPLKTAVNTILEEEKRMRAEHEKGKKK